MTPSDDARSTGERRCAHAAAATAFLVAIGATASSEYLLFETSAAVHRLAMLASACGPRSAARTTRSTANSNVLGGTHAFIRSPAGQVQRTAYARSRYRSASCVPAEKAHGLQNRSK